ncbi:MAG TPA: endonuclease domain-containing protein [Anaeromyxobacter sp.]|nr:endonuclease domain-containing protein [Anaeromyxobacter sp.]
MPSRSTDALAFRRKLRRESTDAECLLWTLVRRGAFGVKFRRQHPAGPYVLDFYCPAHRLAVELDGGQHWCGDAPARDAARTRFLATRGIRVLRFSNAEMFEETEAVIQVIREALGFEEE